METNTNWQRLEQVINWSELSTNRFAREIGLKRSENLYQIKRGSFGISKSLSELICAKYPGVNRAWLLTGESEMFNIAQITTGRLITSKPHTLAIDITGKEYSDVRLIMIKTINGAITIENKATNSHI